MPHIVIFIHEFISAFQHLKHSCHIIGMLPNGAFCQYIQSLYYYYNIMIDHPKCIVAFASMGTVKRLIY